MSTSRRAFLKMTGATALGLTLGPRHWAWGSASDPSPFGPLQDDPLLRLPEGFSYRIVAETGLPLLDGDRPYVRPNFPDLNVAFPQPGGGVLLSTSHEVPPEFPLLTPAPGEEYDRLAGGAVSSLLLSPGLEVVEASYNAGGMLMNCSGSGTPWGTVLTGEESQASLEQPHGWVWEVDVHRNRKVKLEGLGRFDHETAVVHEPSGHVYLTEDSSPGFLYRFRPEGPRPSAFGDLAGPGALEAFALDAGATAGRWVPITDPAAAPHETQAAGALAFQRLEGGRFDPHDRGRFYFTETGDPGWCGRVWRLDVERDVLEPWVAGGDGTTCMPDNLAFDAAGNVFLAEDRGDAGPDHPNHLVFVDGATGETHVFADVVQHWRTPDPPGNVADEPTGTEFWVREDGSSILFLNLQRAAPAGGLTLAIEGPFARPRRRGAPATTPARANANANAKPNANANASAKPNA